MPYTPKGMGKTKTEYYFVIPTLVKDPVTYILCFRILRNRLE